MLGWLRTYLERRRRRAARHAKMAAEAAEMAALLQSSADKRGSRKKKWFGLVTDKSRRPAPVAPLARPAVAAQLAAAPAAPAATPVVAPATAPANAAARAPAPLPAKAVLATAQPVTAAARQAQHDAPELYGPPPPPVATVAEAISGAVQQRPTSSQMETVADAPPADDIVTTPAPSPVPVAAEPPATVVAATPVIGAPIVVAAPAAARTGWLLASLGWVLRVAVIVALIGGAVVLAGWPVWRESQRFEVEIMPLAVPAEFAARGLSGQVAAARLLDAVDAILTRTVDNARNRPTKDELGPVPAIATAPDSATLRGMASLLRDLRGLPTRRIAGEVTILPDNRIAVRLRVPGGVQIAAAEGALGEDVDAVFSAVAPDIWRRLNPLIYAWHVADGGGSEEIIRPKLVGLAQEMRLPAPMEFRISVLYTRSLVRSGRAAEALATIEGLERRGATYPLLWNVKAQALADLGRADAALDAQKQAVAADGTSVWSHITSAHLLMKLGKPREALTDLQSARRLSPNNFDAVMLEGMVLLSLGRPPEALALISRVIDAKPNLPGVQEALGNALLANGRPDEAMAAYDIEIARNPENTSVRLARANALRSLRRPEEALATIEAILRISPRDGTAIAMRGWTLLDLGRADQSLAVFDLLLKERPNDAGSLYGRGMSLAAMGRRPEAIGALVKVMELQPGNRRVAADLARLRGAPPPGSGSGGAGATGATPGATPPTGAPPAARP